METTAVLKNQVREALSEIERVSRFDKVSLRACFERYISVAFERGGSVEDDRRVAVKLANLFTEIHTPTSGNQESIK